MQPPALEPNKPVIIRDRTYHYQAEKQYNNLREQAKLLIKQAREIKSRVALSDHIYTLKVPFKIVMLRPYYLYDRGLSMIGPDEWNHDHMGNFRFIVKQLGDGTWEKLRCT